MMGHSKAIYCIALENIHFVYTYTLSKLRTFNVTKTIIKWNEKNTGFKLILNY